MFLVPKMNLPVLLDLVTTAKSVFFTLVQGVRVEVW